MRTVGTFLEVYHQARAYLNDVSGLPTDPVVRLENGKWIIESRLEPQQETVVEVTLDDFQRYWNESFEDENYIPTEQDVADYVKFVEETQI
jgi:hypothetical protein